jgi:hypothetical protein
MLSYTAQNDWKKTNENSQFEPEKTLITLHCLGSVWCGIICFHKKALVLVELVGRLAWTEPSWFDSVILVSYSVRLRWVLSCDRSI